MPKGIRNTLQVTQQGRSYATNKEQRRKHSRKTADYTMKANLTGGLLVKVCFNRECGMTFMPAYKACSAAFGRDDEDEALFAASSYNTELFCGEACEKAHVRRALQNIGTSVSSSRVWGELRGVLRAGRIRSGSGCMPTGCGDSTAHAISEADRRLSGAEGVDGIGEAGGALYREVSDEEVGVCGAAGEEEEADTCADAIRVEGSELRGSETSGKKRAKCQVAS